jgi:GrpB-like predicted nucleotidyltransferase (UPF0157 family)
MALVFEHIGSTSIQHYLREHAEVPREYEGLKRTVGSREYKNPSDDSAQKADLVAHVLGLAAKRDT